jgi:hypothetical protein
MATILPELVGRIRDSGTAVTVELFINVWAEIGYRYDICLVIHGARIGHL